MAIYFLDTDICIYVMNGKFPQVVNRLRQAVPNEIKISSIVYSELCYGVKKSSNAAKNQKFLQRFISPFQIINFDAEAAKRYAEIRATLESEGRLIGPNDMLIAASALSINAILVTNNDKEFSRVNNLRIENWCLE
jgi:tRNA(fMet)-specific endonuclease VapC